MFNFKVIACFAALLATLTPIQVGAQSNPSGKDIFENLDRENAAVAVKSLLDYMAEEAAKSPAEDFDPAALAMALGSEPSVLFSWVRQKTNLVPYQGTLRGASGVMIDRVGNSLDRSLLLSRLLEVHGVSTRLARARLSSGAAQGLLNESNAVWFSNSVSPVQEDLSKLRRVLVENAGLDDEAVDKQIDTIQEQQAKIVAAAHERMAIVAPEVLTAALSVAEGSIEERIARETSSQSADLQEHWWLQYRSGDDWVDADVTLEALGDRHVSSFEIVDPQVLPIDLFHAVTFRVTIETMSEAESRQTIVLEKKFAAHELSGRSLHLTHQPLEAPSQEKMLDMAGNLDELLNSAASIMAWTPVLTVDGQQFIDKLFKLDGSVVPADTADVNTFLLASNTGRTISNSVGGATGLFGSLLSGENEENSEPNQSQQQEELTAVWLDIDLQIPGRPVEQHRRTILDLLNDYVEPGVMRDPAMFSTQTTITPRQAQKRAMALLSNYVILAQPVRPSHTHTSRLLAKRLKDVEPLLVSLVGGTGLSETDTAKLTPKVQAIEFALTALSVSRWAYSSVSDFSFLDRANVAMLRNVVEIDDRSNVDLPNHEWIREVREVDIVANGVGVRIVPGLDPFQVRVIQGVADTVAESVLLESQISILNTSVLHERTVEKMVPWRVFDTNDAQVFSNLDHGKTVKKLMQFDMERGHAVLAPATLVSEDQAGATWWRIDPRSGTTLGMTERGTGGMSAETVITLVRVANAALCFAPLVISNFTNEELSGDQRVRLENLTVICVAGSVFYAHGAFAGVKSLSALGSVISLLGNIYGKFT